MQLAHARLAHRAVWALNEKRMVEWAGFAELRPLLASLGSSRRQLEVAIEAVAAVGETVRAEIQAPPAPTLDQPG
jgi:hypothetical protein